jgi:ribonucleoside-diphosphate reductase beta chain
VEGCSKIHHDETRHIGYGVWFLRETVRTSPEMADVLRGRLRELLPSVAASLAPPAAGSGSDFAAIGASGEEIRDFALAGADPGPSDHRRSDRDAVIEQRLVLSS